MRAFRLGQSLAAAVSFAMGLASGMSASATDVLPISDQIVATAPPAAFDVFLDRLMAAESGGRANAKNPRSTALGPFQFIKSTFLDVTRRHFLKDIAGLSHEQILARRTDPGLSRRAATVFCKESLSYLQAQGLEPTFAHLRLAYLLGPADAARIMQAEQQTPVVRLLSPAVIKANPFMRSMSVTDLLAKSERDVSRERPIRTAASVVSLTRGALGRKCKAKLASCRKFQALRVAGKSRRGSTLGGRRG